VGRPVDPQLWDNPRRLDGEATDGRHYGSKTMLNEQNRRLHEALGISADYGASGTPSYYEEATDLVEIGPNLVGHMQRLTPLAAARWQQMVSAASDDGVRLLIVSGFRDFEYQAGLIRRKLEAGQVIDDILTVNAAPGFSQHHTGCAVDIATPGSRPLTEEFEESDAFDWLTGNGSEFGFSLSYPRENPQGFVYEPWHWALNDII
jgi:D-alanyl-D-alanine carboxypeptidase